MSQIISSRLPPWRNPDMAYSESLAGRIRDVVADRRVITAKKMSGGVALLMHGNMCPGVWKTSPIARLGPEQAEIALKEPVVPGLVLTHILTCGVADQCTSKRCQRLAGG
jgi:hypothetical protein